MSRLRQVLQYRAFSIVLLTAVALGMAACGNPEPQPLHFGDAVWRPGETSLYRATDLNGEPAGTVRVVMQQSDGDGWRMERVTQTQGDEELLTVDMAAQGFRPRASILERSSGGTIERVEATYDHGQVHLALTTKGDATTTEVVSIPSDSRDARTMFMLVRTLPLTTGFSTRVNTFLPVAARMARTTVTVLGDETVETPAGTFDAWLTVLDEGDRQSRAWISKEKPFPLVKYVDGANSGLFELVEFNSAD